MRQYLDLMRRVLDEGVRRDDRTGVGTLSVFGHQMRFDLREAFPLLTTKRIHLKSIIHELLWFISGSIDARELQRHGVKIWDEWATKEQCARFGREAGHLGPVYGHQWRNFDASKSLGRPWYEGNGVDQLANVVKQIQDNPNSRRHIVTAWNPREVDKVTLPPCHTMFQFYVHDGELSCQLYQRSGDIFLGVPFNIASYALLTMMVAEVTGLRPGNFVHTLGDAHLYLNHLDQARLQLTREPRPGPIIYMMERQHLDDYRFDDFLLAGYDPHPHIKAEVAV